MWICVPGTNRVQGGGPAPLAVQAWLARLVWLVWLVMLAAVLAGCQLGEPVSRVPDDQHGAPLPTASPAEVQIDAQMLQAAVDGLPPPAEHGLRSLLVLRHGRLVLEQYWNGHDRQTLQDIRSATKSITALLVGVAIDRRWLPGVDDPLSAHLAADYPQAPALRQPITLAHLLTMRSGLACDDRDPRSPGQEDTMYRSRDWVGHFLALPALHPPGAGARYCTGGVVALGRVLAVAAGQPVPGLAEQALFGPLGIAGARWACFDGCRQTDTGGHLRLRPQDMARIGQLVLQRGQWQGRQLVSAGWIDAATQAHTLIDNGRSYGYLWWRRSFDHPAGPVQAVLASGNGGQFIFVLPQLDLVVVFTGGNYNSPRAARPLQMMQRHIVPAVRWP